MNDQHPGIPTWIIVVTLLLALMEIIVSISLVVAPASVLETVDLSAKGVTYIVYMWAARQFALGIILGVAALRRSAPMLTLAYIFFLVMFIGDLAIGIWQDNLALIGTAIFMCALSAILIYFINKRI